MYGTVATVPYQYFSEIASSLPQGQVSQRQLGKETMSKASTIKEFWDFMRVRKKCWVGVMVFVLALLSMLVIFTQTSSVAPFIYTLF